MGSKLRNLIDFTSCKMLSLSKSSLLLVFITCLSCTKEAPGPSDENFVETEAPLLTAVTKNVSPVVQGYYSGVPAHYNETNKKYPLIVFIHGGGQFGNGSTDLPIILNEALPELLAEKLFPASFTVSNKNYSFIVLAPQFVKYPANEEVRSFIDYALSTYRIDASRIYLAGMSNGATITCDAAAEHPNLFAAIVTMAGASVGNVTERCRKIAENKLPVWLLHNDKDELTKIDVSNNFIAVLNSFNPVIKPKFTIFPAFGYLGHDAWTKASNPQFKESNMNIYEWMLQYSR